MRLTEYGKWTLILGIGIHQLLPGHLDINNDPVYKDLPYLKYHHITNGNGYTQIYKDGKVVEIVRPKRR